MPLRESILATLGYYDVLEYPLSLLEVHRYLVNPQRIYAVSEPVGEISLALVMETLDRLVESGTIQNKNGMYFLPADLAGGSGREHLVVQRIEREKISAQKWKRILKIARCFQAVPYLRGLFISGSMAIDNANPESDFDVLVVTAPNRIYTTRVFLSFVASIFKSRRKRYDRVASNKFCFNHYISADSLRIPHESIYNAQTYGALKIIFGSLSLYQDFYRANIWINKYAYNFKPDEFELLRKVKRNSFLVGLARLGERALNSKLGNWLENHLKRYQQNRIKANPMTHTSGGRISYTDRELEFHPRSFEKTLIEKYNKNLSQLCGPLARPEKDSGLQ